MDILPDDAPSPRLCHLIKWPDFDGYGFNLHAERSNPGQFIGKIDDESPAQMAGLKEGDRIVEVNGVNINNENHRQVVERIKSDPSETRLLVVDPETDLWYREQDLVVKSNQVNVVYMKTPVPRPKPDSPRANFHRQLAEQLDDVHQVVEASTASASLSPTNGASSSLETSDFNDDSIEQQQQQQLLLHQSDQEQVCPVKSTRDQQPPMSPDSGKGDEEPTQPAEVVVEAEINRQSPVKPNLLHGQLNDQQTISKQQQQLDNEHSETPVELDAVDHANNTQELNKQDNLTKHQTNDIQPDSLSQAGSSVSPVPAGVTQVSSSTCSNFVARFALALLEKSPYNLVYATSGREEETTEKSLSNFV